jgi:group II intron reverse transcriptase/maturase
LRALSRTVTNGRIHWIVEADIKGFFDHVDHEWLMKFLGHRIGDPRVHRLVRRLLKAGIMEGGQIQPSETGVPQGGTVSPILANVYLHYALDLWFVRRYGPGCGGEHRLIRYADDFVACFEREADAVHFREELGLRLAQFGLEVEASKTKVLAFGPKAGAQAQAQGQGKPETFDFLGFTHYCTCWPGSGRFRLGRVTARKKFRAKLAELTQWLRTSRTRPTRELWATFGAKLRGHFAYYGVTGNCQGIGRFAHEAKLLLLKWLNRRGGQRGLSWEKFNRMQRRFPLPKPLVRVSLV